MHGASGSSSHQIQAEEQLVSTTPGFLELPNMTHGFELLSDHINFSTLSSPALLSSVEAK
jgi:hypothetical protein